MQEWLALEQATQSRSGEGKLAARATIQQVDNGQPP